MDYDPKAYELWVGFQHWAKVFGACAAIVLVVALITALAAGGPGGVKSVIGHLWSALRDLVDTRFRRVWAIALLTIREAIRRRALVVFVLFAVLFMFAGWFLPESIERPDLQVKQHVALVLRAMQWLIIPVIMLLSCWGIPEDIKARSMHTVVTKPARRSEIVMGRMLGFITVGTGILAVMSVVGYIWINRQLSPEAKESLVCRVPVYGQLSFLTREGNPGEGINVGNIWKFRAYIEGATKAAAVWDIDNVDENTLVPVVNAKGETVDGLKFEANFESFRSHKGTIGKGLLAQMRFVNPEKKLRIPVAPFDVAEYRGNIIDVPRTIVFEGKEYDVIDDLAPGGKMRVEVQCLNSGQYLGMARPDLFIRTPDRHFASGYFKATAGIWLMMSLVAMIGVTASCFLKGPVATLLTFSIFVVGQGLRELLDKIVAGEQQGGGPIESIYRLVMHQNQTVPLGEGIWVKVVQRIDLVAKEGLWLVQQIIPNFDYYSMSPYVSNGYDVSWNAALLPSIVSTAAFIIPCILIGFFSLKLRELEAK